LFRPSRQWSYLANRRLPHFRRHCSPPAPATHCPRIYPTTKPGRPRRPERLLSRHGDSAPQISLPSLASTVVVPAHSSATPRSTVHRIPATPEQKPSLDQYYTVPPPYKRPLPTLLDQESF